MKKSDRPEIQSLNRTFVSFDFEVLNEEALSHVLAAVFLCSTNDCPANSEACGTNNCSANSGACGTNNCSANSGNCGTNNSST